MKLRLLLLLATSALVCPLLTLTRAEVTASTGAVDDAEADEITQAINARFDEMTAAAESLEMDRPWMAIHSHQSRVRPE